MLDQIFVGFTKKRPQSIFLKLVHDIYFQIQFISILVISTIKLSNQTKVNIRFRYILILPTASFKIKRQQNIDDEKHQVFVNSL